MADEKPGVKTSEFWMGLMTIVAGMVPGIVAILAGYPWMGGILAAVALVGPVVYIAGRSWLKAEEAKTVDLLSDTWEARLGKLFDVVESVVGAIKAEKEKKEPE